MARTGSFVPLDV